MLRIIGLLVLLMSCGPVDQGADIKKILNKIANQEKVHHPSIGSLTILGARRCTVTKIAEATVLTANHCYEGVFRGKYKIELDGQTFDVFDTPQRSKALDLVILKYGHYDSAKSNEFSEKSVKRQILSTDEIPVLKFGKISDDLGLDILSVDGNGETWASTKSDLDYQISEHNVILHNHDTRWGSSGSPLIQDGTLVGVHLGAAKALEKNVGIVLDSDQLKEIEKNSTIDGIDYIPEKPEDNRVELWIEPLTPPNPTEPRERERGCNAECVKAQERAEAEKELIEEIAIDLALNLVPVGKIANIIRKSGTFAKFSAQLARAFEKLGIRGARVGKVVDTATHLGAKSRNEVEGIAGQVKHGVLDEAGRIKQKILDRIKSGEFKGKQMEIPLDNGSKLLLRRDVGPNAHPIERGGAKVDHYNFEIHVPRGGGRSGFDGKYNLHVILDETGKVVRLKRD